MRARPLPSLTSTRGGKARIFGREVSHARRAAHGDAVEHRGEHECCLPVGATAVHLRARIEERVGDLQVPLERGGLKPSVEQREGVEGVQRNERTGVHGISCRGEVRMNDERHRLAIRLYGRAGDRS
jgi:hypothetical protein